MPPLHTAIPRKAKPTAHPDPEEVAADILGYLAEDAERLRRFFDLTGLTPDTLRSAAAERDFAGNVLEYLCADDRLVLAFAIASGRDPAAIEAMRQRFQPQVDSEA